MAQEYNLPRDWQKGDSLVVLALPPALLALIKQEYNPFPPVFWNCSLFFGSPE